MVGPQHVDAEYEEKILRALRRIIRAVGLHSRELERRHGLTAPQLVCLRLLKEEGRTSSGELARAVSLSAATVTGILDRLERRGLVRRERSASDKRRVRVELTAEGLELVRRAPLPLHERFARRLGELSADRQTEINDVLQQIVDMMEATDIDAAPLLHTAPVTEDPGESENRRHR